MAFAFVRCVTQFTITGDRTKMKRMTVCVLVLFSLCSFVVAQEMKHEVTVQGSGFFNKESTGLGTKLSPTNSGGLMVGYRINLKSWLAAEADYDYFRNSQKFTNASSFTAVNTNVHAITGNAVVKLPVMKSFQPYTLIGGGAMVFDPRKTNSFSSQTVGTFVYGAGADYPVTSHIGIRAQYRGFVYKAADYDVSTLKTDKFTHSAVPSAGLVFKF
jgi:opacity protein-like surface antigen